jgi:hypothetical protein
VVNFAAPTLVGLSFVHRQTQPERRLGTSPSDEAAMSLVDDNVGVGATGTGAVRKVVDLQTHIVRDSPANILASLSGACRQLDVEAFDVYGDFDSDAERSYLRKFEAEVSRHFGKDDGVFCPSGGMAQSIVLAINARRCDNSPTANRDDEVVERMMGGGFRVSSDVPFALARERCLRGIARYGSRRDRPGCGLVRRRESEKVVRSGDIESDRVPRDGIHAIIPRSKSSR